MKNRLFFVLAILLMPVIATAVPITFNTEAGLLGALSTSTTFDFETASGFPIANTGFLNRFSAAPIGPFMGVDFDAHTHSGISVSGTQSMAGTTLFSLLPTFNTGTIVFSGLGSLPNGFGFFGLDRLLIGSGHQLRGFLVVARVNHVIH